MRVLVVDDCPDNRQTLALLLAAWGFDARTAAAGPSALEAFRSWRPDAVVLEPRLAGWGVGRRIREEAGGRAVLLVALTVCEPDEVWAGFDAHLTKPVDLADLLLVLERAANPAGVA
jgi:CheY-like chemotaxis protein